MIAAQSAPADPAAAAAQDSMGSAIFWGVVVTLAAVGAFVAWRLRVQRPRSVLGPSRVPPTGEAWPLGVALVGGFLALIVASTAAFAAAASARGLSGQAAVVDDTTNLVAGIVGTLGGLLFAVLLLAAVSRPSLAALGLGGRQLGRIVPVVAVAALMAIPWTFVVGFLTEWAYQAVAYEHPAEHDLLRTMRGAAPAVRWGAIVSAVVVAPLAEEFFFRGLVQTTIRHTFARLFGRVPAALPEVAGPEVVPPQPVAPEVVTTDPVPVAPAVMAYASPVMAYAPAPAPPVPTAWMGWVAILLTSTLFAAVHPLWTAPIIFFLSIGLGYLYERTGNLWASMGLHAAFNAVNVVLYLAQVA